MTVKVLDNKYLNFKGNDEKTIEGYKHYFINEFAGKCEIRTVFDDIEHPAGSEIEVVYSKRYDKFKISKNKE